MEKKKLVTLLIPCYNEQKSLPALWQALCELMNKENNYSFEVLFVNDGSKDDTLGIIKDLHSKDERVSYIDLSRNFGKENAMLAGFDYVKGDCMVLLDADLQDPPELISEMLKFWEQGYDDVYAKRQSRGKESWLRKKLSLAFYKVLNSASKFENLENVGDFRLLDRKCIEALKKLRENERYTKGMFCWIGFRKKEILFNRGDRVAGDSKWNFLGLFDLAIEGIVSFTTAPLRFATFLGFLVAFFAFIFFLFYVIKTLVYGDPVQGFTTLIAVILFLGGVQLISIGILGEYMGRIFKETKNRPTYLIREYESSRELDN